MSNEHANGPAACENSFVRPTTGSGRMRQMKGRTKNIEDSPFVLSQPKQESDFNSLIAKSGGGKISPCVRRD
jgi:hypothetical protein